MPYASLRGFIEKLEKTGRLKRISEPVSTHLEMTEIGRRMIERGGPAVLFEHVVRSPLEGEQPNAVRRGGVSHTERTPPPAPLPGGGNIPVLINLFGTVERVAWGMGREPHELREIGNTLAFLRQPEPPGGWREALKMLPLLKTVFAMQPSTVSKAPCQEVVLEGDDVDLSILPIQTCWPGDAGPLITWPLVVTKCPVTRVQSSEKKAELRTLNTEHYNLGIYRMQPVARNQTLMRWLKHRGGAQHHREYTLSRLRENRVRVSQATPPLTSPPQAGGRERAVSPPSRRRRASIESLPSARPAASHGGGQEAGAGGIPKNSMPAAAVIGCDPATILAAVTPLPENLSEYRFAGFLRGKKTELVNCKTVPLHVPAHAEIVLEGYVSLDEYGDEGPHGDHTGFYNAVEKFPVFTITAITMRKNPIYLSTYTGRPPDEPSVLGEALNEIFIPLIRQQFPEIVDFYLPPEGCSYRIAVVAIKKSYPGQARRIMMGVWSYLKQFVYTKFVIVVDHDIDVRDWKEVMWAVSTRMDPVRDTMLVENTPIDYLDFASPEPSLGGKMGLDATTKLPPETQRAWGKKIAMDEDVIAKIDRMIQGWG